MKYFIPLTMNSAVRPVRPRRVRRAVFRAGAVLCGRRDGLPAAGPARAGGGDGGVPEGGRRPLPLPQRGGAALRRRRVGPVRLHGPLLQRKWYVQ